METKKGTTAKARSKGASAAFIIFACFVVAATFFFVVCGDPANFDEKGHPLPGNAFGALYMGGVVIPCVMTLLLTAFTLSIERIFAMSRANGKGNVAKFVFNVKQKIENGDIAAANKLCDEQKGSVANILKAALIRYEDVEKTTGLNNDEKAAIIQKEVEEATTLELPYLEKNLNIIASISSLGTLLGLLGTVIGMIRAFSALAAEGAADSLALSTAISEALLNTAMGIGTGAVAIISYTYFSGRIQNLTNAVDEVGFAIGQTYATTHK
jgi:Biopolymer transport proteins